MIDLKTRDILRRYRFNPYYDPAKPSFSLVTWDVNEYDHYGKFRIGYRLTMHETVPGVKKKKPVIIFEGEDFATPDAVDSDSVARGIMNFLTLRPGDTDKEYFEDYNEVQLDFCTYHAETLGIFMYDKFGEG